MTKTYIPTIRTLLVECSIQCIAQQSNHLSMNNESMGVKDFTNCLYIALSVLPFTVTIGSSIMNICLLF